MNHHSSFLFRLPVHSCQKDVFFLSFQKGETRRTDYMEMRWYCQVDSGRQMAQQLQISVYQSQPLVSSSACINHNDFCHYLTGRSTLLITYLPKWQSLYSLSVNYLPAKKSTRSRGGPDIKLLAGYPATLLGLISGQAGHWI